MNNESAGSDVFIAGVMLPQSSQFIIDLGSVIEKHYPNAVAEQRGATLVFLNPNITGQRSAAQEETE